MCNMRFEKADSGETSVTFEVRTDIEFREQIVARDALGSLVHSKRGDAETRTAPGVLAVVIQQLNGIEDIDGEKKPIETALDLSDEEIALLHEALKHFANDTSEAINSLLYSSAGAFGCATRAVEAEMANKMLAELEKEFPYIATPAVQPVVGYAR